MGQRPEEVSRTMVSGRRIGEGQWDRRPAQQTAFGLAAVLDFIGGGGGGIKCITRNISGLWQGMRRGRPVKQGRQQTLSDGHHPRLAVGNGHFRKRDLQCKEGHVQAGAALLYSFLPAP